MNYRENFPVNLWTQCFFLIVRCFLNGQRLNICLSKNGRRLESNFKNVYQMHNGSLVGQCSGKGNYEKVKSGTDIRLFLRNSANQSFTV